MELFQQLATIINEYFTFYIIFPVMLLLGSYFSIKLKFIQITKFASSFKNLMAKKTGAEGNISHFEAISAVLAGNFGTGNISGMAVAVAMGGPGALLWMWVMAFFGASIQYASCFLGVKYRVVNSQGEYLGGPMYYLSQALGKKKLAAAFAILTLCGAVTVGGLTQVNSMMLPLKAMDLSSLGCSVTIALCVAAVILGGLNRMAKFASTVVPLMALFYLSGAIVILFMNRDKIPEALALIFHAAFHPESVLGGAFGLTMLKTVTTGFGRGLFATDSGTGIVPILQASARTEHPVIDGLVTLVAPLLVMVVCTVTGLVLLVTGVWQDTMLESTNMVIQAFQQHLGAGIGSTIVVVSLLLFGYTTILAWACCADKAAGYLFGAEKVQLVRYLFIAILPLGAFMEVKLVWTLADLCISGMLITNMIGIAFLSKEVIGDSRSYFAAKPKLALS